MDSNQRYRNFEYAQSSDTSIPISNKYFDDGSERSISYSAMAHSPVQCPTANQRVQHSYSALQPLYYSDTTYAPMAFDHQRFNVDPGEVLRNATYTMNNYSNGGMPTAPAATAYYRQTLPQSDVFAAIDFNRHPTNNYNLCFESGYDEYYALLGSDDGYRNLSPDPLLDLEFANQYFNNFQESMIIPNVDTGCHNRAPIDIALNNKLDEVNVSNVLHDSYSHQTASLQTSWNTTPSDTIFATFSLSVPSLSNHPLSVDEIMRKLSEKSDEVLHRYLPHVHFLVSCQQELRAAIAKAKEHKICKGSKQSAMSHSDFFKAYLEPLPKSFYRRFQSSINEKYLQKSFEELNVLTADARKVEKQGCEAMKNAFLGGMRDGQSWGLRRWMSNNGGALHICNDMETIFGALQKLPREAETTIRLAAMIRPKLKQVYDQLKSEVPKAYQEHSPAHPYLPFFHRLESLLKGFAEFDPGDDDVICLDDSDVVPQPVVRKDAESSDTCGKESRKRKCADISVTSETSKSITNDKTDDDEVICLDHYDFVQDKRKIRGQIDVSQRIQHKPNKAWRCHKCMKMNSSPNCTLCDTDLNYLDEEAEQGAAAAAAVFAIKTSVSPVVNMSTLTIQMTEVLDGLLTKLDKKKSIKLKARSDFWDHPSNYTFILHLFRRMIQFDCSNPLLQPVNSIFNVRQDFRLYCDIILHPLSFYDIITALSDETILASGSASNKSRIGYLSVSGLEKWNMFIGKHLIEAIDLVMLNALGGSRVGVGGFASAELLSLRKLFWDSLNQHVGTHHDVLPTKRDENSSFVVRR